jgi:glycosyltransferase involved in cell wall biosynthesis
LTKSLVLIVWNECAGCRIDVPRLPVDAFEEVFAIDGGSTDGTAEYLASARRASTPPTPTRSTDRLATPS